MMTGGDRAPLYFERGIRGCAGGIDSHVKVATGAIDSNVVSITCFIHCQDIMRAGVVCSRVPEGKRYVSRSFSERGFGAGIRL